MFYETIGTSLIDVESLPWIPFVPYSNEVLLKLVKVDPIQGEWVVFLKMPGRTELPMHHHSGTVQVYTLTGRWRYLEHDWVATPGSYVYETAGSCHTPVGVSDEEVHVLNIIQGDWNIVMPEGQVLAVENWKTMMKRYLDYCAANDIKPVDLSSFNG